MVMVSNGLNAKWCFILQLITCCATVIAAILNARLGLHHGWHKELPYTDFFVCVTRSGIFQTYISTPHLEANRQD